MPHIVFSPYSIKKRIEFNRFLKGLSMATYAFGHTDTSPQNANYSEARLKLLSNYYSSLIDSGRVQSAGFLLARKGKIFAHQAAGKLTHQEGSPAIQTNSLKKIASITKLFTATAIMKLVEDGKLWLGQPVKDFIPEFDTPMHGGISLWHLLTHTSGLPADPGYFQEPYPINWFESLDRDDWLKKALSGPLQAQPGENWNYCTLGFSILGEVISRASDNHYNDYLQNEIFKPLGMHRSFMEIPEHLQDEVSTCNEYQSAEISRSAIRHSNRPPKAGGGAYSTLYDMYRFAQCFLNGGTIDNVRLIGRKTVEAMTRNQLENVPSFHWGTRCKTYRQGLGWGFYCDGPTVSPSCYNHEGWGWCSLYIDPEEDFIYISFIADDNEWSPDVQVKPRTIAWSGII
jgi:CubicO group peptidase (beta-lactamase class C family)